MIKKFPFPNYIYVSSKPIKNQGDSSIDSDSFKEFEAEIETKKKKDSLINKNKLLIPRESKKRLLQNNNKKKEIYSQKALKLTPHSSTKYSEKRSFKNSFKNSEKEKESYFSMINKIHNQKENNRYNNCYDKVIKNLRFLSCLKDEESDFSEGIIDNEISVNFTEGFNIKSKKIKEKQVEIPLENVSRINTNSEMSNDNICNLIFSKTNKKSLKSLIKEKTENNQQKKSLNNFNKNEFILEDKENYCPNNQYDKEIKIDLIEINQNVNNSKIYINKSKSMKNNINNKYFEIKKSKNSFINKIKNNQRNSYFNFNLTKKYKIFHKFLSIGIDTSGLYTLDEEMKKFILNPKITYNFPSNNLENELE